MIVCKTCGIDHVFTNGKCLGPRAARASPQRVPSGPTGAAKVADAEARKAYRRDWMKRSRAKREAREATKTPGKA